MDDPQKIELNIVARADLKQFGDATKGLEGVDKTTKQAIDSQKKLQAEIRNTANELRRSLGNSVVNPSSTLASSFIPNRKSTAQLQAEERAAGQRTERSMAAEARQAEIDSQRRGQFVDSARRNQTDANAGQYDVERSRGPGRRTASIISTAAAGILTAVGVAAVGAAKGLKEYGEASDSAGKADAALAQRGLLIDEYRTKIHALASEMFRKTGVGKDTWLDAISKLIEYGGDVSNIDQLAKTVENLAGLMGGNVQRASLALSKALVGNFQNLHNIGIIVPENATQMEKMAAVMEQAARGAGVLAAQGQNFAGQLKIVKESVNNFFTALGGVIARNELFKDGLVAAGAAANWLAQKMGGIIPPAANLNNVLTVSSQRLIEVQAQAQAAAREFNSIHVAVERATTAMERQKSAVDALRAAQDTLADAELQLRLAQINEEVRTGRLNEPTAVAARAIARRQNEQGHFQREQAAATETISANERFLNQLGGRRGELEAQRSSLQSQLTPQEQAHAARAELGNAQRAESGIRQQISDMTGFTGAWEAFVLTPANRDQYLQQVNGLQNQLPGATARTATARARAGQFGPELNESNMARITADLATVSQQLLELNAQIQRETPGHQDAISHARLNRDVNAARFGIDQRRESIEFQGQFGHATGQPLATNPVNEQQQQYQALQAAFGAYAQAVSSGMAEFASAIYRDIQNLQAQIRTQSTRR